ncbi:hypothetical protein C482_12904 [Natrialba chahannaoensis JCM 10990]|uniref:Uncharacterized protein n=1 Tax=Natrialba chahannaoensis JCM 10990 TaxID=1227492 RepID=M0AI13_9EURY|nr:hypothetical protein [Natrialba chahannaoensis]ELY97522.1 hypothetical protein C482_12904 [Natrialba chahannaoensis JCM 10990]
MFGTGLPTGTVLAVAVMALLPVAMYLLYRVDKRRGDGHVTILGRR